MENSFYINTSFLDQFSALIFAKGGKAEELFAAADLTSEMIDGTNQLIPLDSFIRLLESSAKRLNFPELSLCLAEKQDITFLGSLSIMLFQCTSIHEVMDTVTQYFRVAVSGVSFEITEVGDSITLRFLCDIPYITNSHQYQDYVLASAAHTIWEVVGRKYSFRGCFFTRPEESDSVIHKYAQYFGCPIAFGSDAIGLTIDKRVLDEPLAAIGKHMTFKIRNLLNTKKEVVTQVTKVVSYCLASGHTDIDTVAKSMGYSRRTLQRRLTSASTSFSDILDSARQSLADQYLFNTSYRLTDIASLLGYNNLSSFTRSYKRWHKIEPNKAREIRWSQPLENNHE